MSAHTLDAIRNATRRARRVEWGGLLILSVLSLAITAASFAATAGSL